jgi:hypothetical protein
MNTSNHPRPDERPPKQTLELSQFSTTTFRVPVRRVRSQKTGDRRKLSREKPARRRRAALGPRRSRRFNSR